MELETQVIAYAAELTEVEFGWGARPDGYVIAVSREVMTAERASVATIRSSYGYDVVEQEFAIKPTEEAIQLLKSSENGLVHVNRQLSQWGVKL